MDRRSEKEIYGGNKQARIVKTGKINFQKVVLAVLLLSLAACDYIKPKKETDTDKVLARFENEMLKYSQIKELVLASGSDSLIIKDMYVDNWLKQKILQAYACADSSLDHEKIRKQVEEYKMALYINAFRNKIASRLTDTLVSEQECIAYNSLTGFSEGLNVHDSSLIQLKALILQNRRTKFVREYEDELFKKELHDQRAEKY